MYSKARNSGSTLACARLFSPILGFFGLFFDMDCLVIFARPVPRADFAVHMIPCMRKSEIPRIPALAEM
jgi:hypothetical protein